MAEGGYSSENALGSDQIVRTKQFVNKQGPQGGVMPRPDHHETGSVGTYESEDHIKEEINYQKGVKQAQSDSSILESQMQDSDVAPSVEENAWKRLINKIKPPKNH